MEDDEIELMKEKGIF